MSRPIYGVYFICCIGHYAEVVEEQLRLMETSGLLQKTKKLLCFICNYNVQTMMPLHVLRQFQTRYPIQIIATQTNLYERFAVENYKDHIRESHYYLYYLHTKGVSHARQRPEYKIFEGRRKNLNHFVITKHTICLEFLSQGYDAIGTTFLRFPSLHFSGNFWWARSEHLMRLPLRIRKTYLAPEMYVCGRREGRYMSICQETNNHQAHEKLKTITDDQIRRHATSTPCNNVELRMMKF